MVSRPHIPHNIDKILEPKIKKEGVWERKTYSQIETVKKELKRSSFSLTMPIGVFLISFIACYYITPVVANKFLFCLVASALLALVSYCYQRYVGRSLSLSPSFKICSKCLKENRIGTKNCTCGGTLEPPEFYDFIEKNK